jgi:mRNA-degrading endonuclease RelE of RelBE toxin-antitoxin system
MAFVVQLTPLAVSNLKAIRAYDRRRIADEIDQQLVHQPGVETRNRKRLDDLAPDFEHRPPVWELRVGDFRIFYDIDEESSVVYVRTIRRKEHGQTTEDITHDASDD